MTLKELLKDKQLPVKVRKKTWGNAEYFELIGFNDRGVVGFFQDGRPYSWIFCTLDAWELYQEPKQKTVLSEYLVSSFSSSIFVNYYLKSDEEFLKEFPRHQIIKTGRTIEVELP